MSFTLHITGILPLWALAVTALGAEKASSAVHPEDPLVVARLKSLGDNASLRFDTFHVAGADVARISFSCSPDLKPNHGSGLPTSSEAFP